MLYAAQADLALHADTVFLTELTNDSGGTTPDAAVVTRGLTFASGQIDTALTTAGITLPTATTSYLTGLCSLLTLYQLSIRRRLIKPPAVLEAAWTRALKELDQIAEGELVPASLSAVAAGKGGIVADYEEITDRDTLENLL